MAYKIYLRDGGLASGTIPPGHTALGSDNGELKIKVGDTVSNVGGGGYRVYTALLTQSGGDNTQSITSGTLTIGVTYRITDDTSNPDFTNVGSPNNNLDTYFVATGTTPNSWGQAQLQYNTGSPVVKVLDNTIGNIWWTYNGIAQYTANSNGLFTEDETILFIQGSNDGDTSSTGNVSNSLYWIDSNIINCITTGEGNLSRTSIEIRVYN